MPCKGRDTDQQTSAGSSFELSHCIRTAGPTTTATPPYYLWPRCPPHCKAWKRVPRATTRGPTHTEHPII